MEKIANLCSIVQDNISLIWFIEHIINHLLITLNRWEPR